MAGPLERPTAAEAERRQRSSVNGASWWALRVARRLTHSAECHPKAHMLKLPRPDEPLPLFGQRMLSLPRLQGAVHVHCSSCSQASSSCHHRAGADRRREGLAGVRDRDPRSLRSHRSQRSLKSSAAATHGSGCGATTEESRLGEASSAGGHPQSSAGPANINEPLTPWRGMQAKARGDRANAGRAVGNAGRAVGNAGRARGRGESPRDD